MNDYIAKPIDPRILHARLSDWLGDRGGRTASRTSGGGRAGAFRQAEPAAAVEPAAPDDDAKAFDAAKLDERLMGDRALIRALIGKFLEDIELRKARLRSALAAGEARRVSDEAHSIKGAASNLAAARLAVLASEIEAKAKSGDIEGSRELFGSFDVLLQSTREAMLASQEDEPGQPA